MRFQVSLKHVAQTAIIALAGAALTACATGPTQSTGMQLGARVAAPVGFVNFCQRSPEQCGSTTVSRPALTAQAEAPMLQPAVLASGERRLSTASWSGGDMPQAPAVQLAASPSAVFMPASAGVRPESRRAGADWSALFAAARAETALSPSVEPVSTLATLPVVQPSEAATLALTDEKWRLVTSVNDKVNRKIIYREDTATFGMGDYWAMPLTTGQRFGDCEDFVLEKRRMLIEAGVPASALSIALVVTGAGDNHAVLVVGTDKGDYVLDNLNPWVVSWSTTGYHWVARQIPGGEALDWAAVGVPRV